MNIADCYRVLGLRTGATYEEIKTSYRRLARQLHPDLNPGDQRAQERFIQVTEAYRFLLTIVNSSEQTTPNSRVPTEQKQQKQDTPQSTVEEAKPPQAQTSPQLSLADQHLKQASYEQLQQLFKAKKFPRAIALVEGLSQRFPDDADVRQWQAITYHQWGKHLIHDRDFEKARLYLKKALRTDPHNQRLWAEIEQDFQRLEQNLYRRR
jgi:tetratricopeptide (TPR) repeat protein